MTAERKISDALTAKVIAAAEEERQRRVDQVAMVREVRSAKAVSDQLDEHAEPRDLRRRASLVIRCADCRNGRVVAHVTYVHGRPLLWCAQKKGTNGSRGWLDDGFWGDVAYCLKREFVLHASMLIEALPRPNEPKAEFWLRH